MSNDDLLAEIRDHVRDERTNDSALEAVARGERGDAVLELERRAAGDAEVAAMLEASRPFGDAAEERIAARVGKANANVKASAKRGVLVPILRRVGVVAAPLMMAAAVVLYVVFAGSGESHAVLPHYSIVASGEKEMRGQAEAASANLQLRGGPDAPFEIVVRPTTTAGTKVVAYVFAIGEREPNPVDAKVEISPEGSVRIRGRARALDGAREIRVVLGTAGDSIKRFDDALARARDGKSDAQVRVLVVSINR